MSWLVIAIVAVVIIVLWVGRTGSEVDLSVLPERFVIFDLETTGLKPRVHEIIEIGAIRVNRDSDIHETFQLLVRPQKRIPKKIVEITGITQEMVDGNGEPLESALQQFLDFIGDLPLVAYNAEFDIAFLHSALARTTIDVVVKNRVSCALKMARRAWPDRKHYRLADLARDGRLPDEDTHRALGDCKRTMTVYAAAAAKLRRWN